MKLLQYWYLLVSIFSANIAVAQVPLWSSYPSAPAVIYLDFDGHLVDGTSWNWSGSPINCSPSGLGTAAIQEVFNRVAEDFRPFNINVTTDSTKFMEAPLTKRMRVIITTSSSWYSNSAGGVAFIGSFTWGDDHPCFVFSALLNYNVKKISEAVAHETGHTLGLYHQSQYDAYCNKLTDYHSGQGSGEIGWAPIMGVGYNRNFTLWSNGPSSLGCTSYQSDLEIIASPDNGFGFRSDDHSNEFDQATPLLFSNKQFEMNGIIHQNTDRDLFRFSMPDKAQFKLQATPYNVGVNNAGSDLDMQITLYDASNNLISVYNPGNLLNSVADTTLNPGMYYLKVEGRGNMFAPAYASLGSYSLHGSMEGGVALPVVAVILKGHEANKTHFLEWKIIADSPVKEQLIEMSTDGNVFVPLHEVDPDHGRYSYRPSHVFNQLYRVKITFTDGQSLYSNVIAINQAEVVHKPEILGNPVKSGILYVNSTGNYAYAIMDLTGKHISNGTLLNGVNSIDITRVKSGLYVIRFVGKNAQWTDKILRQ